MALVSYALREETNSIFLLQDAGRCIEEYCQITTFTRDLIKPRHFRQYMYFAPYLGANGKYYGGITDTGTDIKENEYEPQQNFVAIIDSEVEFSISQSVLRQLTKDYMPAWDAESYFRFFGFRDKGVLLFLRVYEVDQELDPIFLEKGIKGSSTVFRLYDEKDNKVSVEVSGLKPVVSDVVFKSLKASIINLLKAEDALLNLYEDDEKGLASLQARIDAENIIKYPHVRRADFSPDQDTSDNDSIDMAQLDYAGIFDSALKICPELRSFISHVKSIQPARPGEYDYYLSIVHNDADNVEAVARLFEMSLRAAVNSALRYHRRYGVSFEDALQESCIAILVAIKKHNENVEGLFPSYVAAWMRQRLYRELPPYRDNVYVPFHYLSRIEQVVDQLKGVINRQGIKKIGYDKLYNLIVKHTDCDEEEAYRMAYILSPAESLDLMVNDPDKEELLASEDDFFEESIREIAHPELHAALATLNEKERDILYYRYGFGDREESTLDTIGGILGVTRERVRQIEAKAKRKIAAYYYKNHYITLEEYDRIVPVKYQSRKHKGHVIS